MSYLHEIEAKLQAAWKARKFRTGVALDGSMLSDRAMEVASGFNYATRSDKLYLLHITDKTKANLPRNLQPLHLQHVYEGKALEYHVHCEWVQKEKDQEVGTCGTLVKLADDHACDMLVLGSYGRKGEKIDVLGSVSDKSLRDGKSSVCIVKANGGPRPGMQSTIVFATDGSRTAGLAFMILMHRLRQPKDRIRVIAVKRADDGDDSILKPFREMLADKKVDGDCSIFHLTGNETIAHGILRACEEMEADW